MEAPQMHEQIIVIVFLWLALQIPLGSFVGDCIRFGMGRIRVPRYCAYKFVDNPAVGFGFAVPDSRYYIS